MTFRPKLRPTALLLLAAVVLVLIPLFTMWKVSETLGARLNQAEQLNSEINELEIAIGFNGFIHNFKNAVLRRDEPQYIERARADYVKARELITSIRTTAGATGLPIDLGILEELLTAYKDNLDVIAANPPGTVSTEELDDLVRLPDDQAAEELEGSFRAANAELRGTIERTGRLLRYLALIGSGYTTLLALALALIVLARQDAVEAKARLEEAQRRVEAESLFAREMRHRLNNLLAMTKSLSNQTAVGTTTAEEHAQVLEGRLSALAVAQKLTFEAQNETPELTELIECLAIPYQGTNVPRVKVDGDHVRLNGNQTQQMSLVLHEMFTNSNKYGALTRPDGLVSIRVDDDGLGETRVQWTETGGPEISPPKRKGFGHVLINRILQYQLEGSAEFDFRPEGLQANLQLDRSA